MAALALNLLPLGRVVWMPDMLMLLLAFWGVHQPQRMGLGLAFVLGLCMDVQHSALLGQNALAYSLLMFAAVTASRRLLWFSTPVQALQMLPLFFLAHAVSLVVRMASGGVFPGWGMLIAPVVEALLWPLISGLLLAPQRRAPDSDENRPL
ncbi:rod shape-determining protein MreD [compost metagenome]